MSIKEALFAEEHNQIEQAADLYEQIIERDFRPTIDCFINLILIYFVANDPGESDLYGLNLDFINRGNERIYKLFARAKGLYPNSQELLFWENYVHFFLYDAEHFCEIDNKFSRQHETIIPFFYFFDVKNDSFFEEFQRLSEHVKQGRTCKERYIKSICDAKWERREFYRKCKQK